MLSIEEGHPADVEASLRKWKDQFHQEKQNDDELFASTVLVQALLSEDKLPDATAEIERAASLAKNSQNIFVRLQFELVSARAVAASRPSGVCSRSFAAHSRNRTLTWIHGHRPKHVWPFPKWN